MIINRIPKAQHSAPSGLGFTEAFAVVVPSGTGWQGYVAPSYIPAGAVIEVQCCNSDTGVGYACGVSKYNTGSPLTASRYFDVIRAYDAGAVSSMKMYVQLDASRQFMGYAEDSLANYWRITGFWTGVDFTEAFVDITPGTGGSWQTDLTIGSADNVSLVALVIDGNTARDLGVRNTSSSSNRFRNLGNGNPGAEESGIVIPVLLDGSGNCDLYASSLTGVSIYDLGEFDGSVLTYVEQATPYALTDPLVIDTWTSQDFTSLLDQPGRTVTITAMTGTAGGNNMGMRVSGSGEARRLKAGTVNTTYEWGWSAETNTHPTTGVAELIASDVTAADITFEFWGYFKPA